LVSFPQFFNLKRGKKLALLNPQKKLYGVLGQKIKKQKG
jgi:hypothetical protein